MFTKKVRLRMIFLSLFLISLILITVFVLQSLKENVVYFYSPTEISNKTNISFDKKIRIGGLVKENSLKKKETFIKFVITDNKNEIIVTYQGLVPNLFSEGKGVVAEGLLKDKKYFIAEKILAKHDENYMPPEVNDIIKN
tara:strand:+ start:519 stop:938 length:420 start_codon:yes stop_codon:yes gene_type:complete